MGVADFPIETLKLLNIHPDNRKGKGKAKNTEGGSTSTETVRTGRSKESKTTSNTLPSAASSASTLPGIPTPSSTSTETRPQTANSAPRTRSVADIPQSTSPNTPGTPTHRSTFVSEALAASSEVSRSSRSPSRDRHHLISEHFQRPHARTISAAELRPERSESGSGSSFANNLRGMNAESAMSTGKGIGRIVGAGFKSPMDFSLNVAKGFHNVPKLYGTEVRQVDKVTDFQSGMKVAAKVCISWSVLHFICLTLAGIWPRSLRRHRRYLHGPL